MLWVGIARAIPLMRHETTPSSRPASVEEDEARNNGLRTSGNGLHVLGGGAAGVRAGLQPVACDKRPVVTIPAVRKGISNQRMRIVQDIASASSLGLAVRLPRTLTSRRACHSENCYHDYLESYVSIWSVYDREMTLESLRRLGVCVVGDDIFDDELREDDVGAVAPLQWPIAMSDLAAHSATISTWISAMNSSVSFALADSRYCCTLLIPDSSGAVRMLSQINGAFVAAKRFKQHAKYVLQAFRARLTAIVREKRNGESSHSRPLICAVHWRDEDDFVVEEQDLDRAAYGRVMASAVASLQHRCGGALLLLGEVPTRRLESIRGVLSQARCAEPIKDDDWRDYYSKFTKQHLIRYNETCLDQEDSELYEPPRVYTKHSLIDVRRLNWAAEYGGLDDLLAMVDFEIGKRADFFVGSPFSPFSGLVAFSRDVIDDDREESESFKFDDVHDLPTGTTYEGGSDRTTNTVMPPQIDVEDHLAKLFRLQFPHHPSAVSSDPCASLVALSPKLAKRLSRKSCVFDDLQKVVDAYDRVGDADDQTTVFGARKNECHRLFFTWVAPYCTSLLPRALVLILVCVVATRPRRAARPIFLTLVVTFFAIFTILVLCHLNCPDDSIYAVQHQESSTPHIFNNRLDLATLRSEDAKDAAGPLGVGSFGPGAHFLVSEEAATDNRRRRRRPDYTTTGTEGTRANGRSAGSFSFGQSPYAASPHSRNADDPASVGIANGNMPDYQVPKVHTAVVSANFGAADALNHAPRKDESAHISFFLFAENRDFLAAFRGWTLVLPIKLAPHEQLREYEARLKSPPRSYGTKAVAYSKTWGDALERINAGKRRWDRVATGIYPARSGERAQLPFDLASLEYTRRNGIGPKYEDAQNLVDVMAPKFVKLNMFRIDVLLSYDVLIWADASLVLDSAAVSRALRPLFRADADMVVQPHPKRNSTLQELTHILEVQSQRRFKAIASYLRLQRQFYVDNANFTDEHGLYWMAYFGARRTQRTVDFFDRWWLEVRRWQYRDQVSVMYALNSVPEIERPKVTTFDTGECCGTSGSSKKLPKEQVLCVTLVGDHRRCCRRCRRFVPKESKHKRH